MSTMNHSVSPHEWVISYTQNDLDAIREQFEQTEAMKRRWLVIALVAALVALVGVLVLMSTNSLQYRSMAADKHQLTEENAALKKQADQAQQQLAAREAKDQADAQARSDAQSRLSGLSPAVVSGKASAGEIARFARMVYELPGSRIELSGKPPDEIFRNWKVRNGDTNELYALVGGFVDGKWVVYSNLLSRRKSAES
jgi:cell division protein FtsB